MNATRNFFEKSNLMVNAIVGSFYEPQERQMGCGANPQNNFGGSILIPFSNSHADVVFNMSSRHRIRHLKDIMVLTAVKFLDAFFISHFHLGGGPEAWVSPESMEEDHQSTSSTQSQGFTDGSDEIAKKVLPQTIIRQKITPLLPPPVIQAWDALDPQLEPYMGPEPTITLICTVLVAWLTAHVVKFILSRVLGSGKAYKDDEDELKEKTALQKFDATVLLVGPPGSGKTRLFYQLCFQEPDVPTVQSINANVGVRPATAEHPEAIRYMDWPGHAGVSLDDEILLPILQGTGRSKPARCVLVLDVTQSVTEAASVLFQLLLCYHQMKGKNATILVACHKSDLPKGKNPKRVRLQIRSELERLLATTTDKENCWWPAGEPIEWEKLSVRVEFVVSSSVDVDKIEVLRGYCETGALHLKE